MSVQEEIYLPVNQNKWFSYREIAKALDKSKELKMLLWKLYLKLLQN
jgi:hypothetical protein